MMSAEPALSGACAPSEVERSVSTAIAASCAVLELRGSIAPRIFAPFLNPRTEGIRMGLSIIRSGMGLKRTLIPRAGLRACAARIHLTD
jgi:hypothetical protein